MIRSPGSPVCVEQIASELPKRLQNVFAKYEQIRKMREGKGAFSHVHLFVEDFEALARFLEKRFGHERPAPTIHTATWHGLKIARFSPA